MATGALWSRTRTCRRSPSPRCRACRRRSRFARSSWASRYLRKSRWRAISPPRAPCSGRRALSRKPTMIDFNFHQIMAWQRAKAMLDANAIGALRHVTVHWHVESRAIQMRMRSWKTVGDDGGGVLGNFISHCFHYLEWFCGPIAGLSARVSGLPDDKELETTVAMAIAACGRPAGQPVDELRILSRRRSPHRILRRGRHAGAAQSGRRLHARLRTVCTPSGRRAARAHSGATIRSTRNIPTVASHRYRGWRRYFSTPLRAARTAAPGFAEGYRVQQLIDAARRSHQQGAWIDVARETAKEGDARVSRDPRHRRQRFYRLRSGQGAGQGRSQRARARRQFARQPSPPCRGRERY